MENIKEQNKRNFIINGNLWRVCLSIILPLFLYRFVNVILNMFDQVMAAEISGESVSAVSQITQIKQLISAFGSGIASGSAILIANYFGNNKIAEAKRVANISFLLEILIGAFCIVILTPLSRAILIACKVPSSLLNTSTIYFIIQLLEQVFIAFINYFIAIERSKGNSKIILILNVALTALKLSLSALFVYGLKVDSIIYLEIASLIAQGMFFTVAMIKIFSKHNIYKIERKELHFVPFYTKKILKISVPLILSNGIMHLGKIIVNNMCAIYGELAAGALGVSNTLTGLVTDPAIALQDGESTIVAANLGNKDIKRTHKTFAVVAVFVAIWLSIGFLSVKVFFLDELINLYNTKNTTPEFIDLIKAIFKYDCITIPTILISELCLGLLLGYKMTFLHTCNNTIRIVSRIVTLFVFQKFIQGFGASSIGVAMGVSNSAIALFSFISFIVIFIQTKKHPEKFIKVG